MPPADREPTRGSPETKDRILAAAEALFMEQGYACLLYTSPSPRD